MPGRREPAQSCQPQHLQGCSLLSADIPRRAGAGGVGHAHGALAAAALMDRGPGMRQCSPQPHGPLRRQMPGQHPACCPPSRSQSQSAAPQHAPLPRPAPPRPANLHIEAEHEAVAEALAQRDGRLAGQPGALGPEELRVVEPPAGGRPGEQGCWEKAGGRAGGLRRSRLEKGGRGGAGGAICRTGPAHLLGSCTAAAPLRVAGSR